MRSEQGDWGGIFVGWWILTEGSFRVKLLNYLLICYKLDLEVSSAQTIGNWCLKSGFVHNGINFLLNAPVCPRSIGWWPFTEQVCRNAHALGCVAGSGFECLWGYSVSRLAPPLNQTWEISSWSHEQQKKGGSLMMGLSITLGSWCPAWKFFLTHYSQNSRTQK